MRGGGYNFSTAVVTWPIMVAQAAPVTPQPKYMMNKASRATFSPLQMRVAHKGDLVSPRPRKTPCTPATPCTQGQNPRYASSCSLYSAVLTEHGIRDTHDSCRKCRGLIRTLHPTIWQSDVGI